MLQIVDGSCVSRKGLVGAIASAALCLCVCPLAFANDFGTDVSADMPAITDAAIAESGSS